MNNEIKQIIEVLPKKPGVYQFFDKNGKIIYVGKAKDLYKRVNSYFKSNEFENNKIRVLVKNIHTIKYIVVDTESDALLLENNLIKKFQPKYNILLKDDKSFPWICIKNEKFPRINYTRNFINDGSYYFGPYTSMIMVRTILGLIKQLYKLRTCNYNLTEENISSGKYKLCLEFHIGNCMAPCEKKQTEEDYNAQIEQIKNILKGNLTNVSQYLKSLMNKFASEFKFEQAQAIKEKIDILNNYASKSTIVNPSISNVDVFSIIDDEKAAYINYLKVVNGSIIQSHTVELVKKLDEKLEDLLLFAIVDIRKKVSSESKEILIPISLNQSIDGVKLLIPQKGDKKKLLELSHRNAKFYQLEKNKRVENITKHNYPQVLLSRIKEDLQLAQMPERIECFDNSNLQGTNPVASCVVFKNGKPAKKEYRHYNIKSVKGPDDYSSMEEIVFRRYKRLLDENQPLPQLIIIDGGKGQLNSGIKSLKKLKLEGKIAIIGIAKKLEEIFFPYDPIPLYLDKNSITLKLIQQIRDEAHRFGIQFHRNKRSNELLTSELLKINGIGEKTMEILFKEFKTIEGIKNASISQLQRVVGKQKALYLLNYFNK